MGGRKIIPFRRKREGRTNYKKRLGLLKSNIPRLVVRRTNTQMILQIVKYEPDGDKIVCGVNSSSLGKKNWKYTYKNLPACYLSGIMIGKKALANKITEAIVDMGLQTPVAGSRLYAAVKGAFDAGLNIHVSEEIFPNDERLSGNHIAKFKKEKSEIIKDFEKLKSELLK